MPNDSLSDAIKEVHALSPNSRVTLDTLELSHPSLPESIYMVQDRVAHTLTLEPVGETPGVEVEFEPVPFRFVPPSVGDNGIQELTIAIDNVDRRITDFIDSIGTIAAPVVVTYRPYLSDDPSGPQINPPLVLFLTDMNIDAFDITGRATFTSIVNLRYPTEFYDRRRFKGLS